MPTKKKPTARKKAAKKRAAKKTAKPARKARPPAEAQGMHDARAVVHERRFEVRTLVSKVTFAALSLNAKSFGGAGYNFSVDISGLLVDFSQGGCSLVFMKANPLAAKLTKEAECVIQIAPEAPRRATIRWVKDLDSRLINAGLAFA